MICTTDPTNSTGCHMKTTPLLVKNVLLYSWLQLHQMLIALPKGEVQSIVISMCRCLPAVISQKPYVHNTTTTQPFYGPLSRTTRVSQYQKKHSPTHHPDHHPVFISFFHLPRSIASFLLKLRAWQSSCTTSVHVLFGLPLGPQVHKISCTC